MHEQSLKILRLSALSLAVAVLYGCGGSNDATSAEGTAAQGSSVQLTETASAVRVTAAASTDPSMPSVVVLQSQYTFAATLSSGGTMAGTLMLKGEDEDGVTEVEGVLIPAAATLAATPTPDVLAQAAALKDQLKRGLADLRTAYRADIAALSQTLRTAMAAGAATTGDRKVMTPAQQAALQQFKDAFAARTTQYHSDTAALALDIQTQLAALGIAPSRGGDDDKSAGGYKVKGTLAADGKVNLVLSKGTGTSIHLLGRAGTDGNLSGTLTGPAAGDQGSWTATTGTGTPPPPPPAPTPPPPPPPAPTPPPPPPPAPTPPPPPPPAPTPPPPPPPAPTPPPPPAASAANGKVLYNTTPAGALACSVCHTASPANNVSSVLKGANKPTVIANAISQGTGGMGTLAGKFTDAQLADIAAYLGQPNL
jgi:Cytochrome C oxidase, cbb3-type, subunit III